jgi:hypothetical protein
LQRSACVHLLRNALLPVFFKRRFFRSFRTVDATGGVSHEWVKGKAEERKGVNKNSARGAKGIPFFWSASLENPLRFKVQDIPPLEALALIAVGLIHSRHRNRKHATLKIAVKISKKKSKIGYQI